MSNVIIFKNKTPSTTNTRELSPLAKSLSSASSSRRIQANNNGTFKRIFNGEAIGKPLRGELNVIIVNALPKVSRIYYEAEYDPDGEPTMPNCWSNLGDTPESQASDPQNKNCRGCPQNIKGSGKLGGRACRYQRRLAVLVEGDNSGNLYQFNIPAKSLFGKGQDNTHPFESYVKFLIAHGQSIDNVVTTVAFDDDEDGMVLNFTPFREISDDEYAQVQELQASTNAIRYTRITVSQTDGVKKLPAAKVTHSDEPEVEAKEEEKPKKRGRGKAKAKAEEPAPDISDVISKWAVDDEPEVG